MTFVNLSLLAGGVLIAAPIVLHLIMRRRPTLLEFPALRFLQQRHDLNQRRMQLRHLLLLLLRVAVIALLAFALARPRAEFAGAMGSQEAPVAAAMVFDAAPRMEYRRENQTRLEAARDMGGWLLAQLPDESEVAVLDTRLGTLPTFQPDRAAARDRMARMESVANSQSLPEAIESAVKLLRQSSLERKELYIFTDLARAAWPAEQAARLAQRLEELDQPGVYVIDVGVPDPVDYGLAELRLSAESLSSRSPLVVDAQVMGLGAAETRSVQLHMKDAGGVPQKRGEQTCEARPGELQPVQFQIGGLEPGTHQGFVRIVGQDALAADDTRYFTVFVRKPGRILIAAPKPADAYALFLTQALAPEAYRQRGQAEYDCDVCNLSELAERPLESYAAVYVLDPTPIEPAVWRKLTSYAAEGRGVAVFLGRNATPIDAFNDAQAQELMAGKLVRQALAETYLAPLEDQHPILTILGEASAPWANLPVFRYWELGDIPSGVGVLASFRDGRPAILERSVGQGRALTMTTPISDYADRSAWNLLPVGDDAWPFVALMHQIAAYLVGNSEQQWNYLAGQTATLPVDDPQRTSYLLTTPNGLSFPVTADPRRRSLAVASTEQVGSYRVQAGGSEGVDLGFSVNYAAGQTQLERMSEEQLAAMFGPVKYQLARTRDQLDRDLSAGRVGRELYPPLILIVALVLGLELLTSNRFYRE